MKSKKTSPLTALSAPPLRAEPVHLERELRQQRDYLQALINTASPLLVLDERLRVTTANAAFYKHFRVAPVQTLHRVIDELGNGQWNIPKLSAFLGDVLPRHSFFNDFEVCHEFEHLGPRTVLLSGRQVPGFERIFLSIEDITERLESRVLMRASEIRYRRLFEAARDGILIVDPETRRITDANPFMTELLSYSHEEFVGKELWEIGLLKDEQASRNAFRQLQKKHFIRYENLPLQTKNGERHDVEFVSNLYQEDDSEVIQCNIRDITERSRTTETLRVASNQLGTHAHHLEETVAKRNRQLQETVGELEAFSYSVSHDMRAPLRAMQSFASHLADEYGNRLDVRGKDYLNQIMRSAVRLDQLIQDVLNYSQMLHQPVTMIRLSLERLVGNILETFPARDRVTIKGRLPDITGNEALLTQCLSNLLDNAVKFVAPGIVPQVEISSETVARSTVLKIKDNGIGIAPADHERIFRLFERIHPATDYEGTGIGLAIVRKAAERMGAQVRIDSAPGTGSAFSLLIQRT